MTHSRDRICRTCGAKPGQRCMVNGAPSRLSHATRVLGTGEYLTCRHGRAAALCAACYLTHPDTIAPPLAAHQTYTLGSGYGGCSCGWESGHYAHGDDLCTALDAHDLTHKGE